MTRINFLVIAGSILFNTMVVCPVSALDPQGTAFSVNAQSKDLEDLNEIQKIEEFMNELEKIWNEHNIDKVLKFYSDDFVNGDGYNLEQIKQLTLSLWEAYPDIKTSSQGRKIRLSHDYGTVEGSDVYIGTSSKERSEVSGQGYLKAVSTGAAILKKFGPRWKIINDKTYFEKVTIGYGIGNELLDKNKILLAAPDQIGGGQQYTARLDFNLPKDVKAVASISKELLVYPQVSPEDKFRLVEESKLEKLLLANNIGKNELLTATVGLTGGLLKPQLVGLLFLSQRVNIIPISDKVNEVSIIKQPARSALSKSIDFLDIYPELQKVEEKVNEEKQKE